jgi:hypothetical protein
LVVGELMEQSTKEGGKKGRKKERKKERKTCSMNQWIKKALIKLMLL